MAPREMTDMECIEILKGMFSQVGLDVNQVWYLNPANPRSSRIVLSDLWGWREAWQELGTRTAMEKAGYRFPPIQPDCDPDSDWHNFLLWLQGEKVSGETMLSYLTTETPVEEPNKVRDEDTPALVTEITNALKPLHAVVDLIAKGEIPPPIVYRILWDALNEPFHHVAEGTTIHLTGCGGWCPGCLQRPWCDMGHERMEEDEEAGAMVVPKDAEKYMEKPIPLAELTSPPLP